MVTVGSFQNQKGTVTVSYNPMLSGMAVGAMETPLPQGQPDWITAKKCTNDILEPDGKKVKKLTSMNVLINLEIYYKAKIQSGFSLKMLTVKSGSIHVSVSLANASDKAQDIYCWNARRKGWESIQTLQKLRSIENLIINSNKCDFDVLYWPNDDYLMLY
jgi:hypothetical protein